MKTLHFSTFINAPREKVWDTMLNKGSYEQWTRVFSPGEYEGTYEGSWDQGADINFVSTDEDGKVSGMLGRIKESRKPEFVSVEYLGEVMKGEKRMYEEGSGEREGLENYTFNEKDGGTEVVVDITVDDKYSDMFGDAWPKALEILKGLAEK